MKNLCNSVRGAVVLALLTGSSCVLAQNVNPNGFPSGDHYNLNIIGKKADYNCTPVVYDAYGNPVYGNVVFVPETGQDIQIVIKSDKEKYKPGEMAQVTVEVRDYQGNPVKSAELTAAVVDKGILNLVNYELPNPLETFYGPRELGVFTSEMREYIFGQRYLSEKGEVVGGDGSAFLKALGLGMNPRLDFKSAAYYNDKLMIKDGKPAVFTFKIPDNLTSWKIMAVSQTKDACFGSGSAVIMVSKPLMVLSTLPRFIRLNDVLEAGAMIYNYTGSDGNIAVTIAADGPVTFTSSQKTNLFISNNNAAEIRFKMTVPPQELRDVKFTITAKAGLNNDGFEETVPLKLNRAT